MIQGVIRVKKRRHCANFTIFNCIFLSKHIFKSDLFTTYFSVVLKENELPNPTNKICIVPTTIKKIWHKLTQSKAKYIKKIQFKIKIKSCLY